MEEGGGRGRRGREGEGGGGKHLEYEAAKILTKQNIRREDSGQRSYTPLRGPSL